MIFKKTTGYYGLRIIYKNNIFNFCYPHYISPSGILIEKKDVEFQSNYKTRKELVFSILKLKSDPNSINFVPK